MLIISLPLWHVPQRGDVALLPSCVRYDAVTSVNPLLSLSLAGGSLTLPLNFGPFIVLGVTQVIIPRAGFIG